MTKKIFIVECCGDCGNCSDYGKEHYCDENNKKVFSGDKIDKDCPLEDYIEIPEGVEAILRERNRQIIEEGWDQEHDAQHENGELALVAALYASPEKLYAVNVDKGCIQWIDPWPWHNYVEPPRGGRCVQVPAWDKRNKHNYRRRLEIAGALIAAELDRLNSLKDTDTVCPLTGACCTRAEDTLDDDLCLGCEFEIKPGGTEEDADTDTE